MKQNWSNRSFKCEQNYLKLSRAFVTFIVNFEEYNFDTLKRQKM